MDDAFITELFWSRSERAVNALAEKYGGYCRVIAGNILSSREDTEECINDAYFRVWNSVPPNRPQSLKAFVGKIVRRLALDRVRLLSRKKRGGGQYETALSELEETLSSSERTEKHIEDEELAAALNRFLDTLDAESRTVFVMRYYSFSAVRDVAAKIGRDENRVQYILRKTRAGLKDFLEEEDLL